MQKNWDAIGKSHHQGYSGCIGQDGICLQMGRLRRTGCIRNCHVDTVHLPDIVDGSGITIQGRQRTMPVFTHPLRIIANRPAKVQGRPRLRAAATPAGENSLGQAIAQMFKLIITNSCIRLEWHALLRFKSCKFLGEHPARIGHRLLNQREHEPGGRKTEQETGQNAQEGRTFTIGQNKSE